MAGITTQTIDGQFITALPFNIGTATQTSVVAAVAGQRVRVYKLAITAAAAENITFLDGTTALTGAITMSTGQPLVLPMDGNPWLVTSAGNALNITPTSAAVLAGVIWFTQNNL